MSECCGRAVVADPRVGPVSTDPSSACPAGGPGPGHVIPSVTAAAFHATIQMST